MKKTYVSAGALGMAAMSEEEKALLYVKGALAKMHNDGLIYGGLAMSANDRDDLSVLLQEGYKPSLDAQEKATKRYLQMAVDAGAPFHTTNAGNELMSEKEKSIF